MCAATAPYVQGLQLSLRSGKMYSSFLPISEQVIYKLQTFRTEFNHKLQLYSGYCHKSYLCQNYYIVGLMSKISSSATLADSSPSRMLGAWPKNTSTLYFPSGFNVSSWWTGFITCRLFEATQISVGCLTQAPAATRGWSSAPGLFTGNRCVFCLMAVRDRAAFYVKFRC